MAIVLPIVVDDKLCGSGFVAGTKDKLIAVVTALHLLGNGREYKVLLPPHLGDVSMFQRYPLQMVDALPAILAITEPLVDLAILLLIDTAFQSPVPKFISNPKVVGIGEEVLIVGYPFAPMGSFLETVEPCSISALGNRMSGEFSQRYEFIIAHQTHSGSSGSPVIRRKDGVVCGVVRGCLAPPNTLSIANMPIGSDSNVTYASSSHVIPPLIDKAFEIAGILK